MTPISRKGLLGHPERWSFCHAKTLPQPRKACRLAGMRCRRVPARLEGNYSLHPSDVKEAMEKDRATGAAGWQKKILVLSHGIENDQHQSYLFLCHWCVKIAPEISLPITKPTQIERGLRPVALVLTYGSTNTSGTCDAEMPWVKMLEGWRSKSFNIFEVKSGWTNMKKIAGAWGV